jgi:hypothetical protein
MERRFAPLLRELILPLLLFAVILGIFLYGISLTDTSTEEHRLQSIQDAVARSAVSCYAIEGFYPSEISYLKEHYGLMVDEENYVIHYRAYGANLVPDIEVIPLK